jgi:hypothetical protein
MSVAVIAASVTNRPAILTSPKAAAPPRTYIFSPAPGVRR